jgi:hypothetical protein
MTALPPESDTHSCPFLFCAVHDRLRVTPDGGHQAAGLTDREIMAQGRKATVKTLPKYVKRTTNQIVSGTKKRRASRTKGGQLSE